MRKDFYFGDGDEEDEEDVHYGTLLHGAAKYNCSVEVVSKLI